MSGKAVYSAEDGREFRKRRGRERWWSGIIWMLLPSCLPLVLLRTPYVVLHFCSPWMPVQNGNDVLQPSLNAYAEPLGEGKLSTVDYYASTCCHPTAAAAAAIGTTCSSPPRFCRLFLTNGARWHHPSPALQPGVFFCLSFLVLLAVWIDATRLALTATTTATAAITKQ